MMSEPLSPKLLIVGSIGIDTIETPSAKRPDLLGGSASYACAAASFFARPGMVGVVGTDFDPYHEVYRTFDICLEGLQIEEGETFRWSGVYEQNMDNRTTLSTDLNVFADFNPVLPHGYRKCSIVFLANIHPALQHSVLDQVEAPDLVIADTMDLWINTSRDELVRLIGRVDVLTINESEARLLTGEHNLIDAGRAMLEMGPSFVMLKKGEHGSLLFSEGEIFLLPAFPVAQVVDPTGAGDTFAGGMAGHLAQTGDLSPKNIRTAMAYGSVLASFGVEAFSLDRLSELDREAITARALEYLGMLEVKV